jgi:hypothetical protein
MDDEREDDRIEPPPVGRPSAWNPYSSPVPFGSPPDEPVTIEGEVPWELREEVPFRGDEDERDPDASGGVLI